MDINDTLEILKKKDINVIEGLLKSQGKNEVISIFSEFLDRRSYFNIDTNGIIKRKSMNYALPVAAFGENDMDLALEIFESACPSERIKLKKIERLSKEPLDKLMKNFMKIIANNNVNFAIKYSKEIFMRDSDLFYKILFNYTLLEEIDSQKSLMALSLKKLMGNEFDDSLIYLAISYIAKVKTNFTEYESITQVESITKAELIDKSQKYKEKLACKRGMNLLAYIDVLKEYKYENDKIFVNIALKRLEEIKNAPKDLTYSENIIYKGL
jgi:hypothetical protein